MEFEWDRRKAERNLRKHGVSLEEAVSVFGDRNELMIDDPDHSLDEERFISVGSLRTRSAACRGMHGARE